MARSDCDTAIYKTPGEQQTCLASRNTRRINKRSRSLTKGRRHECACVLCLHVHAAGRVEMSANLATVQRWSKDIDPFDKWLRYDTKDGKVTRIFCALCLWIAKQDCMTANQY